MYKISNYESNDNVQVLQEQGPFKVIEYLKDLSVTPETAQIAYFAGQMNLRKRQVICDLNKSDIVLQAGSMMWTVGNVEAKTGIKGAGDLFAKAIRGKVTNESAIKPEYTGTGILATELSYKYPIILNLEQWGGNVVLEDGLFLACESQIKHKTITRSNFSSAVAGGEGLFNLGLQGNGFAVIECNCPFQECILISLDNDTLKIDGSYAIAWSGSLEFSVGRSSKSLLGSAVNGEGLVNIYKGTGKVLMAPML